MVVASITPILSNPQVLILSSHHHSMLLDWNITSVLETEPGFLKMRHGSFIAACTAKSFGMRQKRDELTNSWRKSENAL